MGPRIAAYFPAKIQNSFKNLRDNQELCDFTVCVDGSEFKVHKILLAACSDYFKAMLLHESVESKENKVLLPDVSYDIMSLILDFCYTSTIMITDENVQEILSASSILLMNDITALCVEYIKPQIDASNCLEIMTLADRLNISELYTLSFDLCLEKFSCLDEKRLNRLDEAELVKLISSARLNVYDEIKVFDRISSWVSAEPYKRLPRLDTLMAHVRFPLMKPPQLVEIASHHHIRNSETCRRFVDEAKDYQLLQDYPESSLKVEGNPRFEARIVSPRNIYAVGGWSEELKPTSSVEKYDPHCDKWVEVSSMTRPRCGVGATVLDGFLYAIGGHDGHNYLKSVERFNICSETWSADISSMRQARTSVGVVSLNGHIYAIGGQFSSIILNDVERYDPKTNSWEECPPLAEKRLGAGVAVLNGHIYVMGGTSHASVGSLQTVECYDPISAKWFYVEPMLTARKHLSSATFNGKIYAIGGRSGYVWGDCGELETAECYDPLINKWEYIPSMHEKRSGAATVEFKGLLYTAGGDNGNNGKLKSVEAYDPKKQKWTIRKSMIHERLGGGLAVN